jgi:hypothetical protein
MAIVACFVFRRKISRSAFWDFFDSIGQKARSRIVAVEPRFTPDSGPQRATERLRPRANNRNSSVSLDHLVGLDK